MDKSSYDPLRSSPGLNEIYDENCHFQSSLYPFNLVTPGSTFESAPEDVDWDALMELPLNSPAIAEEIQKRVENIESFEIDLPNTAPSMDISTTSKLGLASTSPHDRPLAAQAPTKVEPDSESAPKSTIKQPKVRFRNAAQVLSEIAEEKRRQKQKKALEPPVTQKSTRKTAKSKAKKATPRTKKPTKIIEAPVADAVPPLDTGQVVSNSEIHGATQAGTSELPPPLSPIALENYFAEFPPPFDPPSTFASMSLSAPQELEAVSFILSYTPSPLSSLSSTPSAPESTQPISSSDLSAIANAMLTTVKQIPVCREKYWNLIRESVGQWKGGKLRAMARMDARPGWWWLRERLVVLLVGNAIKVNDGEMIVAVERFKDAVCLKPRIDSTRNNTGANE